MVTYTDLRLSLLRLGLSHAPVLAHASLSAFGEVLGGVETLLRATTDSVWSLIMPTFTYGTMVTPQSGPHGNGLAYGSGSDPEHDVETFTPDMPADIEMGAMAEALRRHPRACRTSHPILSFAGVQANGFLAAQSLAEPFGVIEALAEADGWVLLLGVDHTVNTSIHYAERLARRHQFIRWALVPGRIVECPGFPGDSAGFGAIADDLSDDGRKVQIGAAMVQAIPIRSIVRHVLARLQQDSTALLCTRPDCLRCNAVRGAVGVPVLKR